MDNISILDKIINNQKAEEIARLNAVEIVNNLLGELADREKDVLIRRFGLHGLGKETLEKVGQAHKLTRERIRQIEVSGIKKLRQLEKLEGYVNILKKVTSQLLEEHGGLMERQYLLNSLAKFSLNGDGRGGNEELIHKSHLDFLISKLLPEEFEEIGDSELFLDFYKLKYQTLDHLEELSRELVEKIESLKKIFKTEELINLSVKLESYNKNLDKFNIPYSLDISRILDNNLVEEKIDVINSHKVLYSILRALRRVEQNKFGDWGIYDWREIKPKTINDKIYLILKNHGKPMHFAEIADRINQTGFDGKIANAATVHNELILDEKYVLVGRGLYGLKDWGYKEGTVADVIKDVLAEAGKPLTREEIIDKVLGKRLVKKTTIVLALMNKEMFEKAGGKYQLAGSLKS
ncbi:MAG: sigma factor-like helix-turn-helix DNA-binding protein [Patescibacteria group bacterium]|nr:sigma factor-like helix-turn-helix DNA-binding protein [Patescibacteria group bacterium]